MARMIGRKILCPHGKCCTCNMQGVKREQKKSVKASEKRNWKKEN